MKRGMLARVLPALALVVVAGLAGCNDLLEPKVYGSLTPQTFFNSEDDFKSALIALYAPFSVDWGTTDQGVNTWYASLYNADPKTYWARSETTTDEMYTPWDPTFVNFTWGPGTFSGGQAANYAKIRFVARATDVIDKIERSNAPVPEAVKAKYVAEAKGMRAWLMWNLYDFFGPANVKLDPQTLSDTTITPRPTSAEYVAAMVKDLTDAIPALPDRYNGDPANWGRLSKGIARMVLLRIYMHEKDWANAEAAARDIMGMGYSLLPNYSDLCKVPRNNEMIYAVPASMAAPNWYFQEIFPSDFGSSPKVSDASRGPGWYGYWMPWSFYRKFDPSDRRLETILASYTTNGGVVKDSTNGMPGAVPMKCAGVTMGGGSGAAVDWPVFRYAEVLLSLAEAINEQRGPDEAYQYVNLVRERAGVPDFSGLTQAELRDSLLDERGRELYGEGVRRMDLIRAGKYISLAQDRGASAKDYMTLFPIPLSVVQQGSGIITQNPGY